MLTEAQTHYLLSIPKYVIDGNGVQQSSISIDLNVEYKYRLDLRSVIDDVEYNFLLVIDRGKKYTLKLTLHCQDSESKDCIVRIDYNSAHTNPSRVLDTLPDQFCPFAGAIIREPHIHYNIDGYKPAQWALPLSHVEFVPKELLKSEFSTNFAEVIRSFMKLINLETTVNVNEHRTLFS